MKYQKKKRKGKKETRETTPEFIHVSGIKRRILRGTKNEWKKKKENFSINGSMRFILHVST